MNYYTINLDDINSWPTNIHKLLKDNLLILKNYEVKRAHIDQIIRTDVLARLDTPKNPFTDQRKQIISNINTMLSNHFILGWHCTRLLPHERDSISSHGIRRHDRTLFEHRIDEAIRRGHFPNHHGRLLLKNSQAGEPGRDGLLYLTLNQYTLKSEQCVGDLLCNWGGEAIYNNSENIGSNLHIGTPTIIEAAIPLAWITNLYISIGELITSRFLVEHDISSEHGSKADAKLDRDLPADNIRHIICANHPSFETMTEASKWKKAQIIFQNRG